MRHLYKLVTLLLLGFFLFYHWSIGVSRYVDADEFAHLHWAANLVKGQLPYRDFVTFFPPFFHMLLVPILKMGWLTTEPLIWGRMIAFVIFCGLCVAVGGLYRTTRPGKNFFLPALVLAFLPMPFDKFLEIRPDTLAVGLLIAGLLLQIKNKFFLSGVFYACALLVLTKVLPQVAFASVIVLLWSRNIWFFVGLALPIVLFLLWAFAFVSLDTVWYQLIILPIEANKLGSQFFMAPDLFFYPNQIFYGADGWSRGLLANHAVWIVGILGGIYTVVTSWNNKANLLIAGMFFVSVVSFMYGFPLRHSQYLIPIAVFVAYFAADVLDFLYKKSWVLTILVLLVLFDTFVYSNGPKLAWKNTQDIQTLQAIIKTIPSDAYVLDLVGTTLYYNDPYPLCCIPFGQWQGYMSRPLGEMNLAQTSYIYEGKLSRAGTIDLTNFIRHPTVEGLWRQKK